CTCPDSHGRPSARKFHLSRPGFLERSHQSTDEPGRTRGSSTDQKCRTRNLYRDGIPDTREGRRGDRACQAANASNPCPPPAALTGAPSSSVSTPYSCP